MEELKDILGMITHNAKLALAETGKRASASAIRSLAKDVRRGVGAVDQIAARFLTRLDVLSPEDEPAPPKSKAKRSGQGHDFR